MVHALKTEKEFFEQTAADKKRFEVRKNDRPYEVGDYIALNEWENSKYTGRMILCCITYILNDDTFCKKDYVILGTEPCEIRNREKVEVYD